MDGQHSMTVLLGLGSNLGDRLSWLRQAVQALGQEFLVPLRVSPIYESVALLPPGAPAEWDTEFLNMVAAGETKLSAIDLLRVIKGIEARLGRQMRARWAPREIDIDILAYGGEMVDSPELVLPHPGIVSRDFVLLPLADLAPHWHYPCGEYRGKTASDLVAFLGMQESQQCRKTGLAL